MFVRCRPFAIACVAAGTDDKVSALRGDEGRDTNLHAVWDTGLINLSSETEIARAERLLAQLVQQSPPLPVSLDPVQWAEESHEVGLPGPDPIVLDDAYRSAAIVARVSRWLGIQRPPLK